MQEDASMHEDILESIVAELPDGPIFSLALFCASRYAGGTVSPIIALDLIWKRKMNVLFVIQVGCASVCATVQCGRAKSISRTLRTVEHSWKTRRAKS